MKKMFRQAIAAVFGFLLIAGTPTGVVSAETPTIATTPVAYGATMYTFTASTGTFTTSNGTYQATGGCAADWIKLRKGYRAVSVTCHSTGQVIITSQTFPACGSTINISQDSNVFFTDQLADPCTTQVYAAAIRTGNVVTFTNPTATGTVVYYGYTDPSPTVTFTNVTVNSVTNVISGTATNKSVRYVYDLSVLVPAGGIVVAVAS